MSLSNTDRIKQRRRLIKAAAGVPVAFMLPSGAALAASSAGACLNGENSVIVLTDKDEFLASFPDGEAPQSGNVVTLSDDYGVSGDYVYDEEGGQLVSASCWNSINAANASVAASTRIV